MSELSDYMDNIGTRTIQSKVFKLLSDKQWHCRDCEGKQIASGQYAGGGGIQGLQRGTKTRPGIIIETRTSFCENCRKQTQSDRWVGEFQQSNATASIPKKLVHRIFELYKHTDSIEGRKRQLHELVIDHRFPMERWGTTEENNKTEMPDSDIIKKFQILKKDSSGNHNLLKSRACEYCIRTKNRGCPFGIKFWYEGTSVWADGIPEKGKEAELGCHGCGWYNFDMWRTKLNEHLSGGNEITFVICE